MRILPGDGTGRATGNVHSGTPPAHYSFPNATGYADPTAMLAEGYAALGQAGTLSPWRYFALGHSGFDRAFARYLEEPGRAATWADPAPALTWCICPVFRLWYAEDGVSVCECGHPDAEHLDAGRMCLGDVLILGGAQ